MKITKNTWRAWRAMCYPLMYVGNQVLLTVFASMLLIPLVILGIIDIYESEAILLSYAVLIAFAASMLTCLLTWLILRKEWKRENFWDTSSLSGGNIILSVILTFTLYMFTVNFIAVTGLTERFTSHDELMDGILGNNLIIELLAIGLAAPILEEVIFRGIVLRRFLGTSMNVYIAVFLQAFIFGAVHLNVVQGIYAFLIGFVYGLIYLWSKSVWIPIIIHVLFNSTGVIISHLPIGAEAADASAADAAAGSGIFAAVTVVSLVISAGLLRLLWKRFENNKISCLQTEKSVI
jgi:hypothetical protein